MNEYDILSVCHFLRFLPGLTLCSLLDYIYGVIEGGI
jgi:hypothetical protein